MNLEIFFRWPSTRAQRDMASSIGLGMLYAAIARAIASTNLADKFPRYWVITCPQRKWTVAFWGESVELLTEHGWKPLHAMRQPYDKFFNIEEATRELTLAVSLLLSHEVEVESPPTEESPCHT